MSGLVGCTGDGLAGRLRKLEAALRRLEAACPESLRCGVHCESQHASSEDQELAGALAFARSVLSERGHTEN